MIARRMVSVLAGVVVLLSAELWLFALIPDLSAWPLLTREVVWNTAVLVVFAVAGSVAGAIARRADVVPLVGIEVFGVVLVVLSLAIAAVERGAEQVARNAAVGGAALALMAVVYVTLQRLTRTDRGAN
jgi:lysylphosphatidylglycerol synthetase-like protein (DUF2156 family)